MPAYKYAGILILLIFEDKRSIIQVYEILSNVFDNSNKS